MTWWAIDVRPRPSRREWVGRLAGGADRAGGGGAGRRHAGHLRRRTSDAADALIAELGPSGGRRRSRPARRPLEPVDWTTRWRDGLGAAPVRPAHGGAVLGRRAARPVDGPTVVLDPETAFGSGEHGSTRAALTLLERSAPAGRPGARPRQRQRHPRDRGGEARRRAGGRDRERPRGEPGRACGTPSGTGRATGRVPRRRRRRPGARSSAPPTCSSPTSSARVNTALLPAIVSRLRPGGVAIFSGMEQRGGAALPAAARSRRASTVRGRGARRRLVGGGRRAAVITVLAAAGVADGARGAGWTRTRSHHLRVRRARGGRAGRAPGRRRAGRHGTAGRDAGDGVGGRGRCTRAEPAAAPS